MSKLLKRFILLSLASIAVIGCSSDGGSDDGVVDLVLSGVTSTSGKDAANLFAELVEEKSEGTINIEVFHDNVLGDDRVATEGAIMGNIDIVVTSTSPISNMYSDLYLFDAPYLFLSTEEVYKKLDGEVGQKILAGMSDMGLKGLAFWENGFRNFTNNDTAVRLPADVNGYKIRTMENEIHLEAWKAFGANPTPMAFTELFTALQQGTVDAQENPLGIIEANKFTEVQDHVSLTQHVYTPYLVAMNEAKFESLDVTQQQALLEAIDEATNYQRKRSQELEQQTIASFIESGTTVVALTVDEKAQWQKAIQDADIFDLVKSKMTNPHYLDELLAE